MPHSLWDLGSPGMDQTQIPAEKGLSPNLWNARESPTSLFKEEGSKCWKVVKDTPPWHFLPGTTVDLTELKGSQFSQYASQGRAVTHP